MMYLQPYENLVITTAVRSDKKVSIKEVYDRSGVIQAYKQMIKLVIGDFINKPAETSPTHMIYAMDIKSGEIIWKDNLGIGAMVSNNKSGAPVVYEDKVFVGVPLLNRFMHLMPKRKTIMEL